MYGLNQPVKQKTVLQEKHLEICHAFFLNIFFTCTINVGTQLQPYYWLVTNHQAMGNRQTCEEKKSLTFRCDTLSKVFECPERSWNISWEVLVLQTIIKSIWYLESPLVPLDTLTKLTRLSFLDFPPNPSIRVHTCIQAAGKSLWGNNRLFWGICRNKHKQWSSGFRIEKWNK